MKQTKNIVFIAVAVIGVAIFASVGRTNATDTAYLYDGEPEIIAATFSSAWCSSCKILEPRLRDVAPEFADSPVKFVKLDFTFGQRGEIEDQARAEGLEDIYPQYKGATGFTLLVDADTGEIVDSLTINHSPKAMRAAIARALAAAQ
ncbi:MAG: thioredoxin domain-containing protein [Pseudomonadota bacterium]